MGTTDPDNYLTINGNCDGTSANYHGILKVTGDNKVWPTFIIIDGERKDATAGISVDWPHESGEHDDVDVILEITDSEYQFKQEGPFSGFNFYDDQMPYLKDSFFCSAVSKIENGKLVPVAQNEYGSHLVIRFKCPTDAVNNENLQFTYKAFQNDMQLESRDPGLYIRRR